MSYYTLHPRGSLRCVVSERAHPEISLGFAGRTSFSGAPARIDTPRPRPGRPYSRASRRWASWAQSDRWSGRPPGAPPSSLASSFTGGASPRRPAGAVAPRVLAATLRWRLGAPCVPLARGSVVPCSPSLAAARLRARGGLRPPLEFGPKSRWSRSGRRTDYAARKSASARKGSAFDGFVEVGKAETNSEKLCGAI